MASGKKNYFRHSVTARNDDKIVSLVTKFGKEAYFHYMALVEMCAQKALNDDLIGDELFVFHKRTVCAELMVTPQRLSGHLLAIQSSLLGDLVVSGDKVEIKFPKLAKYLGKYTNKNTSKSTKKRKEKERKEKKIYPSPTMVVSEIIEPEKPTKNNLQENLSVGLFEVEQPSLDEEPNASELATKVLTALNTICFRSFRPTAGTLKPINARINEGYRYEDFVAVIKHFQKKWGNNPQFSPYLQPSTLFNNKFDERLEQSKNADKPLIDPLDAFFAPYVAKFNQEAL